MRKITSEELRVIQMDILSAVDAFCAENNIKYSISSGTLLGAVRHKGFIPWDDDIDICMPREDYNKFERLFPQTLDNHYKIWSYNKSDNCCLPFGKVYDIRTMAIERKSSCGIPGVFIDVFPFDEVPDSEDEFFEFNKLRRKKIFNVFRPQYKLSKDNSLTKNIGIILYKLRFLFTPLKLLAKDCINYCQIYNNKGYNSMYETSIGFIGKKFNKSVFDDITDYAFEDRMYKGFNNYDEYLSNIYGDYMTPPPLEKRKSPHSFDFFWK